MTSTTSVASSSASDLGRAFSEIAKALPDRTKEDLKRLLAHNIAIPATGQKREMRLGLLVDLMSKGTGEIPSVASYESARKDASDPWPTASTLVRSYRSWLGAVKAATKLHFVGSPARVPSGLQHAKWSRQYSRDEVIAAIARCNASLGDWPTASEYQEWAKISRQVARTSGLPDPRLPVMKPIRRYFGTFEAALSAARRPNHEALA